MQPAPLASSPCIETTLGSWKTEQGIMGIHPSLSCWGWSGSSASCSCRHSASSRQVWQEWIQVDLLSVIAWELCAGRTRCAVGVCSSVLAVCMPSARRCSRSVERALPLPSPFHYVTLKWGINQEYFTSWRDSSVNKVGFVSRPMWKCPV